MIYQGDAIEQLGKLDENSINMCITSPPYYGLRDYGTAVWIGGDDKCDHKKGTLQSDKSTIGKGVKYQTAGMPYKDICGKCGAERVDNQLGLEHTPDEYIHNLCNVFDEVKRVLRKDGTCWVNIGDSYNSTSRSKKADKKYWDEVGYDKSFDAREALPHADRKPNKSLPTKSLIGIPFRFALEMINRGWTLRNTIIWHKPSCMPSPAKDRFTVDFEYMFFFSQANKYYFKQQFEPAVCSEYDKQRQRVGKKKYYGKRDKAGMDQNGFQKPAQYDVDMRNTRTVWSINPAKIKEAHFATYPEELIASPIDAGCPPKGVVLDPFAGSGTTGIVAQKQGKKFVLIELNKEYVKLIKKRVNTSMDLFFE